MTNMVMTTLLLGQLTSCNLYFQIEVVSFECLSSLYIGLQLKSGSNQLQEKHRLLLSSLRSAIKWNEAHDGHAS